MGDLTAILWHATNAAVGVKPHIKALKLQVIL
jgi:hypothetical protein